jgi:hypothetical protein
MQNMTAGFNESDGFSVVGVPGMSCGEFRDGCRRHRTRISKVIVNSVRNNVQVLQADNTLVSHAGKTNGGIDREQEGRKS